jgi:ABC-2 type transport system ATP-binding protein
MKVLTCYLPADSGSASVAGYDVFSQGLEVRKRIGYLPENNPVYLDMGIVEFLTYIGKIRGMKAKSRKESIAQVIEQCGLTRQVGKDIGQLSKGNRQRVGLAAALLHQPDVLILDEPTTGLDPNQIGDIRDLIRSLAKNRTVVLSTHTLPEVEATCTRAIIVHNGLVVADGKVEDLRTRGLGKPSVVARIKGAKVSDVLSSLQSSSEVRSVDTLSEDGDTIRFRATLEKQDFIERVFDVTVQKECKLLELTPEGTSLEEAFASLTR